MSNKMKTGVRLQFERGLLRPVYQLEQAPRRVFPRLAFLVGLVALVALAVGATHFLRTPMKARDAEPIVRMAANVIEALKSNGLSSPLAACAESEAGATLLGEEDKRLFKARKPALDNRRSCMESLRAIRETLTADGVAWEQVRPLAVGGAEAKVLDAASMNEAARSLTGAVYFAAADRVYALELTARHCRGQCIIVDIWGCSPVKTAPADVETDVDERYRAFREEPAGRAEALIKSARRVFVTLS